jgi:hypothetical protein
MELTFDRASKFYEPGEKITGLMIFKDIKYSEYTEFTCIAECYQDTVSQIRGPMGRPALDPKERTYFMKKDVDHKEVPGNKMQRKVEFVLEATEPGEKLLDVYVGVEFSIIVSQQNNQFLSLSFSTKSQ